MKRSSLSSYFEGVGAKRLTATEVDPKISNQHEFQGVQALKTILGESSEKRTFCATFMLLDDEHEGPEVLDAFVTWSNVRRNRPNRSAEYHLYYAAEAESLVRKARPGDLLLVAKMPGKDRVVVFIIQQDSTVEKQLLWLFGIDEQNLIRTHAATLDAQTSRTIGFAATTILDSLGIAVEDTVENRLEEMLRRFNGKFPSTSEFSAFARSAVNNVDPVEDPDTTLVRWIEQEELLFRTLERHIVGERLEQGFISASGPDVDAFVSFSLSVQNRRKSRAGHALENHLEVIFTENKLRFARGVHTENRAKPDFLFPGAKEYHDPNFDSCRLTVLGVKNTCKDRWRQVLSEAARIHRKHLLTLQPSISEHQTSEMQANQLQLVLPYELHSSFSAAQRTWLLTLADFINETKEKQASTA